MLFNSPSFLIFFLPTVLVLAFLLRRTPAQNAILFVASLLFYAWGELAYTLILIGSIALNYAFGLWIDGTRDRPRQRWVLVLALSLNLSILAYFKYANFVVDSLNTLLAPIGFSAIQVEPVHLPIGISFFTFQAMTYVVDVYRQNATVDRSPWRVGLYIALFPQLIAGPIVRYRSVAAQLRERRASPEDVAIGIRRFVVGLGKKVLIADQLALTSDRSSRWRLSIRLSRGSASSALACRSTSISRATPTWRLASGESSASTSRRISTHPSSPARCRSSGGGGTSRCRDGFATTSTSRSPPGENRRAGATSVCSWSSSYAACGTEPTGTSSHGGSSTERSSRWKGLASATGWPGHGSLWPMATPLVGRDMEAFGPWLHPAGRLHRVRLLSGR